MRARFARLQLENWRQFRSVDIEFHERLTVLTGANGAGKTTILNLVSRHFGWSPHFVGTLFITKRGAAKYFSGAGIGTPSSDENISVEIGTIEYGDGSTARIRVPTHVAECYHPQIEAQQAIAGIYITSHRPVYSYQKVAHIPTAVQANQQLFEQYLANLRQYYNPNARIESPSHRLKSALISLATFGYGNAAVEANDDARSTFEGFERVLRQVLPAELGFTRIQIRLPDVILTCRSGDFSIDAASGGVAALIDLAWQLHMKSLTSDTFVVVLDEPENHLHPKLQRSVLPGLMEAFPQAQFVAATHNPFVVTSVSDSAVVVLDFIDDKVESSPLPMMDRSGSANRILMDVLGVPFPVPLWVETEVDRIVNALSGSELTEDLLSRTRAQLADLGLGDVFPNVVERLLDSREGSR